MWFWLVISLYYKRWRFALEPSSSPYTFWGGVIGRVLRALEGPCTTVHTAVLCSRSCGRWYRRIIRGGGLLWHLLLFLLTPSGSKWDNCGISTGERRMECTAWRSAPVFLSHNYLVFLATLMYQVSRIEIREGSKSSDSKIEWNSNSLLRSNLPKKGVESLRWMWPAKRKKQRRGDCSSSWKAWPDEEGWKWLMSRRPSNKNQQPCSRLGPTLMGGNRRGETKI